MSSSSEVFAYVRCKEDIPDDYLCDICTKPVLDAQIAMKCGHTFCGFCVDTMKSQSVNVSCAICRQPVMMFCRNIFASKVLAKVKCECLACKAEFNLDTAKQHVRSCTEIEVGCSLCGEHIKRGDQVAHSQECPMRDITCECGKKLKKGDENSHKETICEFTQVGCPLNCGETVKRYLIPSHTLQCPAVATVCPVKECGQSTRRGQVRSHIKDTQMRHFAMLQSERESILWKFDEIVPPQIRHKPSGEIGVFTWKIPSNGAGNSLKMSPSFEKWGKKWRHLHQEKAFYLEYNQGVEPVHMYVSFIFKTQNCSLAKVHNIPFVKLTEGKMVKAMAPTATNIEELTVKMEVLRPEI